MRQNVLIGLLICMLVICSAAYVRYCKNTDSVSAMSGQSYGGAYNSSNLTFSDLADRLSQKKS